jgi:hypothetical protein
MMRLEVKTSETEIIVSSCPEKKRVIINYYNCFNNKQKAHQQNLQNPATALHIYGAPYLGSALKIIKECYLTSKIFTHQNNRINVREFRNESFALDHQVSPRFDKLFPTNRECANLCLLLNIAFIYLTSKYPFFFSCRRFLSRSKVSNLVFNATSEEENRREM